MTADGGFVPKDAAATVGDAQPASLVFPALTDAEVAEFRVRFAEAATHKIVVWPVGEPRRRARPAELAGRIIITWPPPKPPGMLLGCLLTVHDADTGQQIMTVTDLAVCVSADNLVWAEVMMHTDGDGKPLYDGPPVLDEFVLLDGTTSTSTRMGRFVFDVAEMRVAG